MEDAKTSASDFSSVRCRDKRGRPVRCSPSARRSRKGQQTSTATDPDTFEHQTESRWAVETHGLTKQFGENVAVNNVELLVPRGCAFGYLGPNGAGKTP